MHIDTHGIHGKEVSLGMMEHGSQSNQGNKSTSFILNELSPHKKSI